MSIDTTLFVSLGLLSLIFALTNKKSVKEDYWGTIPNRTWQVERSVQSDSGKMYTIPGYYQSMLSPRFSNVNYGAYIRYNLPGQGQLGVPLMPLQSGKEQRPHECVGAPCQCNQASKMTNYGMPVMEPYRNRTREGYQGYNGTGTGVVQGYMGSQGGYTDASQYQGYNGEGGQLYRAENGVGDISSCVGESCMGIVDPNIEQPIIYDRFIFANQRSRLNGLGDPIRGDIPIAPITDGWFRPSCHPQTDLRQGALTIVGGTYNQTANALDQMQSMSSGGLNPNMSPNRLSPMQMQNDRQAIVNMTVQKDMSMSNGRNDLLVSAFP